MLCPSCVGAVHWHHRTGTRRVGLQVSCRAHARNTLAGDRGGRGGARARLQLAAVGVQDVAGLQVAVQHPVVVQKRDARQQLLHQALDLGARSGRQQ